MTINVVLSYPLSGSWGSIDRYLCLLGVLLSLVRELSLVIRVVWILNSLQSAL